jgi:hypothetical protein
MLRCDGMGDELQTFALATLLKTGISFRHPSRGAYLLKYGK